MTVSSATNKSGPYTGNGATTTFAYGFRIVDQTHLQVVKTVSGVNTVAATSEYSVTGVGNAGGGNVVFSVAPPTGTTITILRSVPFTQTVDLENQGAYYAETIEQALDLSAMRDQQMVEELDRAVKIPVGSTLAGSDEMVEAILNFGTVYQGTSATAPTTRLDGSALQAGDLYYNTTLNGLYVRTSTEWVALSSVVNGTLSRQTYTATAAQTVFAVNYDVGFVDVWLNGVKLVAGTDFTATNGTSITLTTGAALNDVVDIIAFGTFALATTLDRSENLADLSSADTALTNLGGTTVGKAVFKAADAAAARTAIDAPEAGNITTTDIAAATLVTAADTIASNNNDTTIPTTAAVKAYADGAATTDAVLTATAGASAGAVGTYIFAQTTGSDVARGGTISGASLLSCSAASRNMQETNTAGTTFSASASGLLGTWRCMGTYDYEFTRTTGPTAGGATLWLRIS